MKIWPHVGVCYRPPDQGEPTDKAFFLQLQEASCSQALIQLEDFNHPDIWCKSNMESCRQFKRLRECIEDNFLSQVTDGATWGDATLDMMVINASELSVRPRLEASWVAFNHTWVEFTLLSPEGYGKGEECSQDTKFKESQIPVLQGVSQ